MRLTIAGGMSFLFHSLLVNLSERVSQLILSYCQLGILQVVAS